MKAMVVIPTYNERENIDKIVRAVLDLPQGFHVLIVDDNSPDGTGALADRLARWSERVHALHREQKEGIGPAYVAGFRYALDWGAEFVIEMDADFSHNPADLPRFLEAAREVDVVVGSRYKDGVRVVDWAAKRLLLSLAASFYVKLVLGIPVEDPTGGFTGYRRRVLESLDLSRLASRGYSFQIEMKYRSWKKGFRLKEIPIVFCERRLGGSKITKNIVYEALYILWRIRFMRGADGPRLSPEAVAADSHPATEA
jgi:dolichol-phosphate mannosyltransferase